MLRRKSTDPTTAASAQPLSEREQGASLGETASGPARKLLSICEDLDGALRVSSYLTRLEGPIERQDLAAADAAVRLRDPLAAPIDLVLFAPAVDSVGLRPVAQELVELAVHRAGGLVVLLAPGQAHGLTLAPSAQVVVLDPTPEEAVAAPRPGFFARLFGRTETPSTAAQVPLAPATTPLRLISLQGLAGGAGSTTIAALLAAELSARRPDLRVLLIDLDLQFGQIGAYLDLKDDSRITDLYSGFGKLDLEAFRACLRPLSEGLQLLAAPHEILPLDALDARKMLKFLNLARQSADLVILDLPHALPDWLDPIWREADLMIWVAEPSIRSSHAYRRMKSLSEGIAFDPRRSEIWLNCMPTRAKAEEAETLDSLRRAFGALPRQELPDGGPAIRDAQIQGICPRQAAARSALVAAVAEQSRRLAPRLARAAQPSHNAAQ